MSGLDAAGRRRMMAVDFDPDGRTPVGKPRPLFEFDPAQLSLYCRPVRCFDVAPDGQHFYVVQTPTPSHPPIVTRINLIENWFEELKAKVPTNK